MFCFQKIGDPINLRYEESQTRPQALESLGHEIQLCKKNLALYEEKVRISYITAS